jgi:hypothetical protein
VQYGDEWGMGFIYFLNLKNQTPNQFGGQLKKEG